MKSAIIIARDNLIMSYQGDKHPYLRENVRFPDRFNRLKELAILNKIFFPRYWNCRCTKTELTSLLKSLAKTFYAGVRPYVSKNDALKITDSILISLGEVREALKKDVGAAYAGDPAAKDYTEIIRCYPGFKAMIIHRVAHKVYKLGAPSYARELNEHIHSATGIDIHPGATIGDFFFIDHGTGVVIGETCEIGKHVRIYQGVTLGVLHFAKGENGVLQKGYKRHPTLGDNVVVGAGAKILGPITVGNLVSIGANSWIQEDVADQTTVYIDQHPTLKAKQKNKS
jgi:serine O-acetyltransferase